MDPLNKLEWRNLNSNRNYPFTDQSILSYGEAFIPQSWILDARIYARGNYAMEGSCYVSKMIRTAESVALQISNSAGELLGEAVIQFSSSADLIPIYDEEIPTGCLVLDPARNTLLQAVTEGEYSFDSSIAMLLPSVCEYLPATQVQSINGQAGTITLTGGSGIRVSRVNRTTLEISIVGDPHFNRHGCVTGQDDAANDVLDLNSVFLKKLSIVHYVKTPSGTLGGPVVSRPVKNKDGSISLALKTAEFNREELTLDLRPALRFTTEGNALVFSMAGAT